MKTILDQLQSQQQLQSKYISQADKYYRKSKQNQHELSKSVEDSIQNYQKIREQLFEQRYQELVGKKKSIQNDVFDRRKNEDYVLVRIESCSNQL